MMTAPINVKIKLEDGGILPTKGTPGSAAYDVYLPCDYTIKEGRQMLPLNFRMEMPDGYEAMIEPRSGFSSKGMEGYLCLWNDPATGQLMSTGYGRYDCDVIPGKVDADYRGIVGVIVINKGKQFVMRKGTRIAQMTIRKVENAEFVLADTLSNTERGTGGFGHTNSM